MRDNTLVTGGSDGSVRVWSLSDYKTVHRLAAHDNSVTSLQFSDMRIISGGSDGRVKVWDMKTGLLIRELGDPADAVWRIVFEEEKAVVVAGRNHKTVMEVSLRSFFRIFPADAVIGMVLLTTRRVSARSRGTKELRPQRHRNDRRRSFSSHGLLVLQ